MKLKEPKMSNNPNPEDSPNRRDTTIAFVIQSMKEHEQNLDKLIQKLTEIKPQMENTKELQARFEQIEAKIADLEKEIKRLTSYLAVYKK